MRTHVCIGVSFGGNAGSDVGAVCRQLVQPAFEPNGPHPLGAKRGEPRWDDAAHPPYGHR